MYQLNTEDLTMHKNITAVLPNNAKLESEKITKLLREAVDAHLNQQKFTEDFSYISRCGTMAITLTEAEDKTTVSIIAQGDLWGPNKDTIKIVSFWKLQEIETNMIVIMFTGPKIDRKQNFEGLLLQYLSKKTNSDNQTVPRKDYHYPGKILTNI